MLDLSDYVPGLSALCLLCVCAGVGSREPDTREVEPPATTAVVLVDGAGDKELQAM